MKRQPMVTVVFKKSAVTAAWICTAVYIYTHWTEVCSPPHNSCTDHCLITTEWPARILYRHDFKTFKLYHMLSTYALYIIMKNYVGAW